MPLSDFFTGAQRFAGQAWNALDRSVGGILPGGADNPVLGASRPYFQRPHLNLKFTSGPVSVPISETVSPFEKDLGRVVDSAATSVANAQPTIQKFTSFPLVRQVTSSALNKLPVSANLFGRYYTRIGSEGLELPQSFTEEIRPLIESSAGNIEEQKKGGLKAKASLEAALNAPGTNHKAVNDQLAEVNSYLSKLNKGQVPVDPQQQQILLPGQKNAFNSLSTSLGRAFFEPTKEGGWRDKEKYDFIYGGADKSNEVRREPSPTSQVYSQLAATSFLNNFRSQNMPEVGDKTPAGRPATYFGRAIVSKMDPYSFDYDINIPPNK